MCLDGTLYVEDGQPWLVFCHEWVQAVDGQICAVKLKDDLSEAAGEPMVLFSAGESGWAEKIQIEPYHGIVTDGPWLMKNGEEMQLLWSSFQNGAYAVGIAKSESGRLAVPPWHGISQL